MVRFHLIKKVQASNYKKSTSEREQKTKEVQVEEKLELMVEVINVVPNQSELLYICMLIARPCTVRM